MPRRARIAFEQAFFHVFSRGVAKQPIFLDEQDYQQFLRRLQLLKTKKLFDHEIYAYVLMPNHFHLLLQTKKTPLAKIMSSLLTSYSMYFNRKYQRVGPLFQNRFKSKLCDRDSYFLGASRYIHLNPIEAGIATSFDEYPWSSYQEFFGSKDFFIINREEVSRLIGTSDVDRQGYLQFLLDGIEEIESMRSEYAFERDIEGKPKFNVLSQKKYVRRQNKKMKL